MLQELYNEYKNRENKNCRYNSSAYLKYSNAVLANKNILNISDFEEGERIHYMTNTIIGSFMYNAKVFKITDNIIYIQPCGKAWKDKCLKFKEGDNVYIAKGWI